MTFLLKCTRNNTDLYIKQQNLSSDSGMDIMFPEDITIPSNAKMFRINLGVCLEKVKVVSEVWEGEEDKNNCGYYLYPRSSISKTGLLMANSIGIIDNGYRGELLVYVHNLLDKDFEIKRGTSLFQVCLPSLLPVTFSVVETLSETKRGSGGFGSTSNKK